MDNITEELIDSIKYFTTDVEYVRGILHFIPEIEKQKKLLDFIKNDNDVDIETIAVFALELNED